ncbi:MAG: hypothetical protein WDZ62_00200 [Candidatus Pacearchaeota archaeon]
MKRGLLGFSIFTLMIDLVGAQFYSGYSRLSFRNFFSSLDPTFVTYLLVFLLSLWLLAIILSRIPIFKGPDGKGTQAKVGALLIALGITYGTYRSNFDLGNIFFNLGFSANFFNLIIPFLLIISAALLIWRFNFRTFLMSFGGFLIALTILTDVIYEEGVALISGIIFLLIGLFLLWRARKKENEYPQSPRNSNNYSSGIYNKNMRRGGQKSTRGRFVSEASVDRYERRFGKRAARRRFGR